MVSNAKDDPKRPWHTLKSIHKMSGGWGVRRGGVNRFDPPPPPPGPPPPILNLVAFLSGL